MDEQSQVFITAGYTRQRHWETVYHDLLDLYGPMIGIEGPTLWLTYKRFVQNAPDHPLTDLAWPSTKKLAPFYSVSQDKIRNIRVALERAGLITVTKGHDLAMQSQRNYGQQLLNGKAQGTPLTMSALFALGIRNPSTTLFIKVHDPLTFHPFCNKFNLTYSPVFKDGKWEMDFDNYERGYIFGPNRLLAAVRYIEDNLLADPSDRHHWPLVTEEQIKSLLRCKDNDQETINIRRRFLQRRARLVGESVPGAVLPNNVLTGLQQLGFKGSTAEVEEHFRDDPQRVIEILHHALRASTTQHDGEFTVREPAALFIHLLRNPDMPLLVESMAELQF